MTSVVAICNLALSNVGKPNINSLDEATAEARACNQFYAHVRDVLLSAYPWRFANKTAALAEVTNDKPGTWGHAYVRPNDCLKVRWVRPVYGEETFYVQDGTCEGNATARHQYPFELEGSRIYTNLSPALLRYTARIEDATKYPPLFVDALAWHLAVRLAMPLTRDPKIRAEAFQLAQEMQGAAEMADANEVRHTSDTEAEIAAVRDA